MAIKMLAQEPSATTVAPVAEQPTQLRISFGETRSPTRLHLELAGLTLLVSSDLSDQELFTYLSAQRLNPEFRQEVGVALSTTMFKAVVELGLLLTTEDVLSALLAVFEHPPVAGSPATLTLENQSLLLSWDDGAVYRDEYLDDRCAAALVSSDAPFVATDEAWDRLELLSRAPATLGRCSVNADGFIEIHTSRPQLVETAPLPGLFQLDPTHFGVALPFAQRLVDEPGFVWTSRRPPKRSTPSFRLPDHLDFATHITADLPAFVADLELSGARIVRWDQGLGRRIFALAALEALDAYPAAIITAPSALFLWRRHAELIGRTIALTHDRCDLSLVTYHDLRLRSVAAQAIVFDDPMGEEARLSRPFLQKLAHLTDVYRLMLCSTADWPDSPEEEIALMEALRPNEFKSQIALAERYPLDPLRRLHEHVEAYVDIRTSNETPVPQRFKRSVSNEVELTIEQSHALSAASHRLSQVSPHAAFAEVLEIVCAGPTHAVSPKIGAALAAARSASSRGRTIAIATRHKRAASLLRAMLRPLKSEVFEYGTPSAEISIVRFDTTLPDLTAFDEVWVLDYPWSFTGLERAVGPASNVQGPDVHVVHASGSIDDRLALLAARRAELAHASDADRPPDLDEISYLLSPR